MLAFVCHTSSRMRSIRDRWWLSVVAFASAFFPAALPGSVLYSAELPGLASVPGYVQAIVVGLLAGAAIRTTPERRWPLLLLTAVDCVIRSPGLLVAVTSYVAATTYRRPRHLVIYTAAASLLAVLPRPGTDVASSLGSAPLFVWLPLVLGLWTAARGQVVAGLRERAERLEREQAARAEQARAHERARIARDMHDVIAHRVSLMVLRAGALEINATDDRTAAEAELIRTTGKEALTQLRAVLGILDEADREVLRPQPVLADLDWLLDQSRSVGVAVERRDEGTAAELPVMVQHTAYRVVQEALTNVHKYAATATAQVVLRYLPSALDVTVRNTAPSDRAPVMSGGGLGLVGLRERVEVLGGTFVARPEPDGGFIVSATLPT